MSHPTIPFEGKGEPGMAVLLFNLDFMETPNDAAIERLVQETMKFMVHRAEKRKMAMADVVCATQEIMSRFLVSPLVAGHADKAVIEKTIADLMGVATKRAFALLEGAGPGEYATEN